jgi:hypothetical protein
MVRVKPIWYQFGAPGSTAYPHNHDQKESDLLKLSTAIRMHAGLMRLKGHRVIGDQNSSEYHRLIEELGGHALNRHHAHNAARRYPAAYLDQRFAGKHTVSEQLVELESWSLLFQYGKLILIDATHNTNALNWKLFSLMVRNTTGNWQCAAHFLTAGDDGDIVGACIQVMKRWARGRWEPRYWITNDSGASNVTSKSPSSTAKKSATCSAKSIQFEGEIFSKTLQHLLIALKIRRTLTGCDDSIDLAINALPCDHSGLPRCQKLKYIEEWANYARESSPLFLQCKTTNPLKAYHSCLKKCDRKRAMRAFSIRGVAHHVMHTTNAGFAHRARQAQYAFRSKNHAIATCEPWICRLPYPVQALIAKEVGLGRHDLDNSDIRDLDFDTLCDCLFFRKYQLPCRHIWASNRVTDALKPTD